MTEDQLIEALFKLHPSEEALRLYRRADGSNLLVKGSVLSYSVAVDLTPAKLSRAEYKLLDKAGKMRALWAGTVEGREDYRSVCTSALVDAWDDDMRQQARATMDKDWKDNREARLAINRRLKRGLNGKYV